MEEREPNYVKGFNDGYKLAKFQPELLEKLKGAIKGVDDYERGLVEGVKEHERESEKVKGRITDLNTIREGDKGKERERG